MRVFCIVEYKGTRYYGWERQVGQISIEEEIENALSKLYNQDINIYGSGRTDAGVHAFGQTFHFDVDDVRYERLDLKYRLNAMLPADINIKKVEFLEEGTDFHSRYSAKSKVYEYRISQWAKNPFRYDGCWMLSTVNFDTKLLEMGMELFKGKHNFMNFTSKEEDADGFVREIYEIKWGFDEENREIGIRFEGNGFMRYQIRFMVGTLVAVATGKVELEYIEEKLNNLKQRSIVNYKAPAQGLYLMEVKYK